MANYVEYIKVGSGESWPVRDADAQSRLAVLEGSSGVTGALESSPARYSSSSDSDESNFETWLDTRLDEMSDATAISIAFSVYPKVSGQESFGFLYKHNASYAELIAMNHGGQLFHKYKSAGTWQATRNWSEAIFATGDMILSSRQYGTALPTAGTPGRIFFKKV